MRKKRFFAIQVKRGRGGGGGFCTWKFFLDLPNYVLWKFSNSEDRAKLPILYRGYPFLALFGVKMRDKQFFFKVKKRKPLHFSSANWPRRLIFGYVIQLWVVYWLTQKKSIFCDFSPPTLPPANLSITEFWSKANPASKYQIHCQSKHISRIIWSIFVSVELIKWFSVSKGKNKYLEWPKMVVMVF